MKETKRAEFDNIGLDAVFVNGALDHLTVWGNGIEPKDVSRPEAEELCRWLAAVVAPPVAYTTGAISVTPVPAPDTLRGCIATATAASTAGQPPRVSDAESVRNRVPLSKALAADGMALEDLSAKITAPVQVKIEK